MEDRAEVWPPTPTTTQAATGTAPILHRSNGIILFLGLLVGLAYCICGWLMADWACRLYVEGGGWWNLQLPFGLGAPMRHEFIIALAIGLLPLLLLMIVLRRPLRDFVGGLAPGLSNRAKIIRYFAFG